MKQNSINPTVANFSQLPDEAMIRPKPSAQLLGISIATLWRLIRDNKLQSIKVTERTTAIKAGDLRAYIAAKAGV
jgi:predicted DNA-binding transcriptional regulator AlpA